MGLHVHLVDGTYELFRHFHGAPPRQNDAGEEVAATRGTVRTVLQMLDEGATHLGVATDHVIESFRNDLWPSYKDGSAVPVELSWQFPLLEEALRALGVAVWAMVEDEADDALGAAALLAAADPRVERVWICTPDKDLGQVVGGKVVQLERRTGKVLDAAGVQEKLGVPPASVPDYLALVGDSADGFPGLPGWGSKSAAAVLRRWRRIEDIPPSAADWEVAVRSAGTLAATLHAQRDTALLFKVIATLRTDCEVGQVDDWRWAGPTDDLAAVAARLDDPALPARVARLAAARAAA